MHVYLHPKQFCNKTPLSSSFGQNEIRHALVKVLSYLDQFSIWRFILISSQHAALSSELKNLILVYTQSKWSPILTLISSAVQSCLPCSFVIACSGFFLLLVQPLVVKQLNYEVLILPFPILYNGVMDIYLFRFA